MAATEDAPQISGYGGKVVEIDRKPEDRTAIEIDGKLYEIPRLDDLDMDEEEILYDACGVILPDFMPANPAAPKEIRDAVELVQAARTRNPRFKRALCMIAYRRAEPELELEVISQRIGRVNAFDAELALYGKAREAEDDESPK